jgi:hypothetical protein
MFFPHFLILILSGNIAMTWKITALVTCGMLGAPSVLPGLDPRPGDVARSA